MNLYYIHKCQILVDMILDQPLHSEATQEMVDELKQEGFINKFGYLTEDGKLTAKVIAGIFKFVEKLNEKS